MRRRSRHLQVQQLASQSTLTRRDAAKLAFGAAMTCALHAKLTENAVAQDRTVTLTAAASEVSAAPGAAVARSAAASAAAERGAARVEAAAALAGADQEGAIAQGAAALAAAEPDAGALAQGAIAVTSASNQGDDDDGRGKAPKYAPLSYPSPRGGRGGGGGGRGGGRQIRAAGVGGGGRARRRDRVARLPATGAGATRFAPLSGMLGLASAAAALGAIVLRRQNEVVPVAAVAERTPD
jgi:hypothetical protein